MQQVLWVLNWAEWHVHISSLGPASSPQLSPASDLHPTSNTSNAASRLFLNDFVTICRYQRLKGLQEMHRCIIWSTTVWYHTAMTWETIPSETSGPKHDQANRFYSYLAQRQVCQTFPISTCYRSNVAMCWIGNCSSCQ